MFKKLKDKLAEEVKSSPQRIQQFAQAAQAAVTSASSSISDITNNDLFSIGDNDSQQSRTTKLQASSHPTTFQDVPLAQATAEFADFPSGHDVVENQRQRRLSNSSMASDISFRLPSYETPSMYHLQSDMEVSASEAEERGFSAGTVSLDRVTKEQLYAAYRRTQERYTKYRTQYGDLARHYKLLERENAKARSVLVETQDKALRRISELREQCALEQSAKAHLEKALRVEIEEKNIKIDTLNTKVQLLQNDNSTESNAVNDNDKKMATEVDRDLINLSTDNDSKPTNAELSNTEITNLNNKIEKMEQLLNKYKESLKTAKDKNSQAVTELQMLSNELESKNKEIEQFKVIGEQFVEAQQKIQELNHLNEDLQNKINAYDFTKTKEMSTLEIDVQKYKEEIAQLSGKIEVFSKREEEYAISLAENKLSIHKELEGKESEIKSLKENLSAAKKEIQSLNIVVHDYKASIASLEEDRAKLTREINELNLTKVKLTEVESQLLDLTKVCQSQEQSKTKAEEEYKCLQLQLKQETAEKLAMIDRNVYLESRNAQLTEENVKKKSKITSLENELQLQTKNNDSSGLDEKEEMTKEIDIWKSKYDKLESEIQEERVELVKLQSEIEKLLANHELIQTQNSEFRTIITNLKIENASLHEQTVNFNNFKNNLKYIINKVKEMQQCISVTLNETKLLKNNYNDVLHNIKEQVNVALNEFSSTKVDSMKIKYDDLKNNYKSLQSQFESINEQHIKILESHNSLVEENNNLKSRIQVLESENDSANEKNISLNKQVESTLNELKLLKNEKQDLLLIVDESEKQLKHLQATVETEKSQYLTSVEKLTSLEKENQLLSLSLNKQVESTLNELQLLKNEKQDLLLIVDESEKQLKHLQTTVETEKSQYLTAVEKFTSLEKENQLLSEKIKSMDDKNTLLCEELHKVRNEHNSCIDESIITKKELKETTHAINDKIIELSKLEEINKILTNENISLKSQTESFAGNLKDLEFEINEVRQSHAQIEIEKDRLNSVIEQMESKEQLDTKCTQTDNTTPISDVENEIISQRVVDTEMPINNYAEDETGTHIGFNDALNHKNTINMKDNEIYISIKADYDKLKDENKRLQSDVEGLQSYLTKISKENSMLNDKLRELISTSEHSSENCDMSADIKELTTEIQLGKNKMDDLLRENTLLIEENLELKDQLQMQHYTTPAVPNSYGNNGNNNELFNLKEKYNNLTQENSQKEQKLVELEQMNKSVNLNLHHVQEKNEKLKLSNEKLERRLDEALVSLRHLHSLQENTELEYLRNILYEYLTGSGTHSVTLAKVLSAIVKFDDTQTQLVLQKEKERQGFLRQLGI